MVYLPGWWQFRSGSRRAAARRRAQRRFFRPRLKGLEERYLLDAVPAFPGAVGFGALATGGRGGTVYHVTNLNDSGPGSFRDAVAHTNRTVVFDVGGTIHLNSAVSVASNLTIAGQTAPGDGIAIIGREVSFSNSHNDIVRYLRFRQGSLDPDHSKSTLGLSSASDMIFDHVSIEFGSWDNIDVNSSTNITFQNCIIADPIYQQFNAHQASGSITWYNDVWANAHNRNPLATGNTEYVNNVVYNFQAGYTAGNTSGHFSHDVIDNYFITGPSTSNAADTFYQMANQSLYFSGNYEDSNRDGRLNGGSMGLPGGTTRLGAPWSPVTASLATTGAADAYAYDLANAGDSLHRDGVDAQVIGDVTSLGRSGHLWTSQTQTGLPNNGYGVLNGGPTLPDSDGDGMPDGWEVYYGLNPAVNNAKGDFDGTGYTNIEKYVNGLADGSYGWVPVPWQSGDVGGIGLAGTTHYHADGSFTVGGSGLGIGGTNDQFTFVSQPFSLDGTLTTQVLSQTNTNGRAEAGVMFRNSTADNAAFAEADVTPDGHVFFQWRASDGGSSSYAVAYAHAPVWVQLTRAGSTFTASYSTDGTTWTPVGTHVVDLAADPLAGLVVSSHDNTALSTATFANVSVLPAGVMDQDIGSPAVHGSATFDQTDGAWTVSGSGADIWNTADQFHFAYQGFSGDGEITARVTAVGNTGTFAKAGVMIRDSLAANSMHALVDVTPGAGVEFIRRTATGANAVSNFDSGVAAPYWVRLARRGYTFTAYDSSDGVNWHLVGSVDIPMAQTVYAGLAVCAFNNGAVNASTFDNVSVVAQADLSAAFSQTGAVSDGAAFAGGLDGNGDAYSAALLGSALSANGYDFNLGAADAANAVQAAGQTISLPAGQFAVLSLLGTGVNGPQPGQTFIVSYADGSSDTFTQDLSDWLAPQGYGGEAVAAALGYYNYQDGSSPAVANYLYQYSFILNGRKAVSSITLPANGNVLVLALDLGTAGTANPAPTAARGSAGGGISAQGTGVQNADPGATTGEGFRDGLTPGAPVADVPVVPGNGATFQGRGTPGGQPANVHMIAQAEHRQAATTRPFVTPSAWTPRRRAEALDVVLAELGDGLSLADQPPDAVGDTD